MTTFISESFKLNRPLVDRIALELGIGGFQSDTLGEVGGDRNEYIYNDSRGDTIVRFSYTDVFNAFEFFGDGGVEKFEQSLSAYLEGRFTACSRGVVNLSNGLRSGEKFKLLAAEEHSSTGRKLSELAGDELIFIASANFIRDDIDSIVEIVHVSESVFAARVSKWTEGLEDYIKGSVSGSPPVVVGKFSRRSSIAAFCGEIAKISLIPGTTFDLGAVDLARPMMQHSEWSVALNQGDAGYEDAVFAVCAAETEMLSGIGAAIAVKATIDV